MDNDMEIMKEFEEFRKGNILDQFFPLPPDGRRLYDDAAEWLDPAVKREIVRAVERCKGIGIEHFSIQGEAFLEREVKRKVVAQYHRIIDQIIGDYSPPPRYCEGMQEAIKYGLVKHGMLIGKTYQQDMPKCPWCKEGENCIGGKE